MIQIRYRSGYKYQLDEEHFEALPELIGAVRGSVANDYLSLDEMGFLSIVEGYAWDGPSGPTWDTASSMRASLVHDALYQLLREKLVEPEWRLAADEVFYRILIEDGMWEWRARWWYRGVRLGAWPSADPKSAKIIQFAPRRTRT